MEGNKGTKTLSGRPSEGGPKEVKEVRGESAGGPSFPS